MWTMFVVFFFVSLHITDAYTLLFFFFNDPAPTEIYPLSLHDAFPILLTAVKNFAREEFGLKHRYAMVLHTDEPHPHVHMVVKAMGDDGRRLNIRRETLRGWRREFARSEEHTSELQSQSNLVCRLLLEK